MHDLVRVEGLPISAIKKLSQIEERSNHDLV